MSNLKQIKQPVISTTPLLDQAFVVINDSQLGIDQKHQQVQLLAGSASGLEREYFGDAFSALHLMALWSKNAS